MSNLIVFLAFVAVLYLFDALWDGFHLEQWKPLAKFGWMALGVTLGKILVKAVTWAVNF